MRPSLILETVVGAVFHTAVLFSLFLLFAGHNSPGGGFVGGLVAGAAFVLRYVAGGAREVVRLAPVAPEVILGLGVTISVGTGAAAWALGGEFLESGKAAPDLPLLGVVHLSTALPFDIGVYLVVLGLVLSLLRALGAEEAGS
jgi:multicomponent Na+:H+ antiporter subunit A